MRISDWSSDVCSSDLFPERTLGRLASACNRVLICHLVPGRCGCLPRLRNPARTDHVGGFAAAVVRSEEHTSELQSLMRISSAVFCLKKKNASDRPYNHSSVLDSVIIAPLRNYR